MAEVNRRGFLQTAATASASGLALSSPGLASAEDKPPVRYRLGIVTYNIAARLGPADHPEGMQERRLVTR